MIDYRAEISECCKNLRLSSNLADMAMIIKGDTNQEFLYRLLSAELENRDSSRMVKYVHTANFPEIHDFDKFRFEEVQLPADLNVNNLKSLEFIKEKKNVIMYGGTGTGKTMLSICLGISACKQGIPVKFYRTAGLINLLSEAKESGSLTSIIKKLDKASVIILDEFGYVPYDRTGSQLLFDYLSEIHLKKVIILNTNLEFSRWVNVLYDEQMTAALVGRLMHRCHLLLFPGENNRLRESSINEVYRSIAERASKGEC